MAITPLPTLDRTSPTFKSDVDTFFGSQLPAFAAEANSLQADVTAKQGTASSAAATAATDAAAATTKAGEAAAAAGAAQTHSDTALGYKNEANASKNAAAGSAAAAATAATNAGDSANAAAASAASIADGPVASWNGLTGIITQSQVYTTVRSAVLTGLSTATSTVVAAADSVLVAIGKLQAQVSLRAPLASPAFTGTPTTPTPADTDNSTKVVNSSWVRTSMGNIASAAGFSAALGGVNGYIKFPSWLGGVVLQWGHVSTWDAVTGAANVTFPIAFPTVCRAIVPVGAGAYGTTRLFSSYVNWTSIATSGVEIFLRVQEGTSGVAAVTGGGGEAYWFAIGN